MAAPTQGNRARAAAVALVLACSSVLIPTASALAAVVNPASGGSAVSADQFGTSRYTPLLGPAIAESGTGGELALDSTTTLNIPSGFRLNSRSGALSVNAGCDLRARLRVSTTHVSFRVNRASTVANCVLTLVGLEVQPTSGEGLVTGNITKTGTSSLPSGGSNYGTLTKVAGAVTELVYLTQPSANNSGGSTFGTQPRILARDQFGNNAAHASVRLSIAPGTGASGAHLTCAKNPLRTNAGGVADFTDTGCRIDRAGRYKLRAASGHVTRNSGTFNVGVGSPTRLVFRAYPGTTTKTTLSTQPRVAVVDAGGNTVTTYPATKITLAINKNAGTFTCTGGRSAATVKGIAQFHGCKQTTVATGYRLNATVGFANIMGRVFKVTR